MNENKKVENRCCGALSRSVIALCLLLFIFAGGQVFGQAKFSISAPRSVPVNQNFQLNVTLENANGSNVHPPATNDFQLLGGPNTSTSMQWVNGNVSQSVTYSYIFKPKQEGTFKLGKASITVSGVTMESNELTIEVTKAAAQQQQRQRDPFSDPFFNQQDDQQPEVSADDLAKQLKQDVFLKIFVSKNSGYKGEMLTVTYKLYFKSNIGIAGVGMDKAPGFDGFWSQEVTLDPKRRPTTENLNGKQYSVFEIEKYNLYPQRSGNLPLPTADLEVNAQVQAHSRSRNIFDDFFNAGRVQQIPLKLKSDGATVAIKDLPEAGKPADFNGAVGKFNFETSISGKEGKTDDPLTYTVKIAGTGNLKLIESPTVNLPPAFEVYDPKVKENITNSPAGLTGSKQYDFLIIPRQPGDYKIDKHAFSYFDPSTAKYITINSPEYALKITGAPSKNPNTANNNSVSQQNIALIGQDVRYIKTNVPAFDKNGNEFFGSIVYYGLYTTPFLLFIGFIALKRRNEDLAADVIGAKRRRALKLAKKRLSIADKYLKTNDKKAFYDEVSRAIWGYLGDRLNIDMAGLSKDNVEEKLVGRSVKPETIANLKSLINTCELALYSPVGEGGEMKKNYETALNLIADIEDEIKK